MIGAAPGSPFAINMEYLGLENNEMHLHEELMEQEMRYWPESLQALAKDTVNRVGLCGDVMACVVADWIKGKRLTGATT